MNILYLSHLRGSIHAGPSYSVPKQIEAQSEIDNICWFNAVKNAKEEWKTLPYYFDLNDINIESIKELAPPFNQPDLIIVEGFYNMTRSQLRRELLSGETPYIIIPRGELTTHAQARKAIKKQIANAFLCRHFAKNATAIQYLTEQEKKDSGGTWNQNSLVIPNGIETPRLVKQSFSKDGIKCISIGRIEPYQKGLDMLIEACAKLKFELQQANVTIDIYGPDVEGKRTVLEAYVKNQRLSDIIRFFDGVYGAEKEEVLLEHDVFLMPSRFEGHPMALIEALSYGLPCVATTGSNMRGVIEEKNAGWTCSSTENSLKDCFMRMINERNLLSKKSDNARALSLKYAWRDIASFSHKCYQNAIEDKGKCI